MKPPDPSRALLEKAAQDEFVVDQIINLPQSPDEVIGFHLQQAAEKLLKALLCSLGVHYRRTHNLGELAPPRRQGSQDRQGRPCLAYSEVLGVLAVPVLDRRCARRMVASLRRLVEGKITGT